MEMLLAARDSMRLVEIQLAGNNFFRLLAVRRVSRLEMMQNKPQIEDAEAKL